MMHLVLLYTILVTLNYLGDVGVRVKLRFNVGTLKGRQERSTAVTSQFLKAAPKRST